MNLPNVNPPDVGLHMLDCLLETIYQTHEDSSVIFSRLQQRRTAYSKFDNPLLEPEFVRRSEKYQVATSIFSSNLKAHQEPRFTI